MAVAAVLRMLSVTAEQDCIQLALLLEGLGFKAFREGCVCVCGLVFVSKGSGSNVHFLGPLPTMLAIFGSSDQVNLSEPPLRK